MEKKNEDFLFSKEELENAWKAGFEQSEGIQGGGWWFQPLTFKQWFFQNFDCSEEEYLNMSEEAYSAMRLEKALDDKEQCKKEQKAHEENYRNYLQLQRGKI